MPPSNVTVKDMGLERIMREAKRFRGSYTKIGLPSGEFVATGEASKTPADVVMIGAVHEWGAPSRNIPERSWLRSAYDKEQMSIRRRVDASYDSVLQGKTTARFALAKLGEWFTARIKANFPPSGVKGYAKSTLAMKKRKNETNPQMLIETGQLRNSITHVEVMRG
jgi:phage gpG-like protein